MGLSNFGRLRRGGKRPFSETVFNLFNQGFRAYLDVFFGLPPFIFTFEMFFW